MGEEGFEHVVDQVAFNVKRCSWLDWEKHSKSIIAAVERFIGKTGREGYSVDPLYHRLRTIESDNEQVEIFYLRNWQVETYKPVVAHLRITCKDKISFQKHHEMILTVGSLLDHYGLGYRPSYGEVCIITMNESLWRDFVRFMVPRWMDIGDAHYWDEKAKCMKNGFDPKAEAGYFNWGDQSREIHWYCRQVAPGVKLYKVEIRMGRDYLRNHEINSPEALFRQSPELIKGSISLREFDIDKIMKLKKLCKKKKIGSNFTRAGVPSIREMLETHSSAEVLKRLSYLLKGHYSPAEIKERLTKEIPFPEIRNNYMPTIPFSSSSSPLYHIDFEDNITQKSPPIFASDVSSDNEESPFHYKEEKKQEKKVVVRTGIKLPPSFAQKVSEENLKKILEESWKKALKDNKKRASSRISTA